MTASGSSAMQTVRVVPEKMTELLSLCMARDSWSHTIVALNVLKALELTPNQTMYDVLLTAACVLYMRPFEKSHGLIRLVQFKDFQGPDADDLRRIHVAVDKTRNQIMAHQQISGWDSLLKGTSGALPAERLIVRIEAGKPMSYEVTAPTLERGFIEHFLRLACVQQGRANQAFFNAMVLALPNLIEGRGEFLIETEETKSGPTRLT